jgi:CDP-4-dehydro-6-deoxyglucose reductase, E1
LRVNLKIIKNMIKLIKSTFYNEDATKKRLAEFIVKSDILSMGAECKKFEARFSKKQGRKHSLFVSSGSMANLVLIQALLNIGRLKKGDKVFVSSLTWATNIMPIIQLGLIPVVLDCEMQTLNVSSKILIKNIKITNAKAMFLTNALGFSDDIKEIRKICKEKDILLLEDNCESLGSKVSGILLGNFGLASTFSTFVGHHFSTIEGGMICTDDEELYNMLILARAHGWDRNLSSEKQKKIRKKNNTDDFFSRYTFYDLAYNARPTEINGFIGNIQLQYWDTIVSKREKNFKKFHSIVTNNNDFLPLCVDHMETVSNFAMPIICKNQALFMKYREIFEKAGVEIRPIIAGDITKQPFYQKYVTEIQTCKNADFVHKNGFYFPNNPELNDKEINLICNLLK